MTDREQIIRGKLFRTFGGPSYEDWSELLEDAKHLANLLAQEREETALERKATAQIIKNNNRLRDSQRDKLDPSCKFTSWR